MGNWRIKKPNRKWYQTPLFGWVLFISAFSYYPFNPSLDSLAGPAADVEKGKSSLLSGNRERAFAYLIPAAREGNPEAQHLIGEEFEAMTQENERLFTRDMCKATYWFDKAARQGHADAQFQMAQAYEAGYGVRANQVKAYMWLRAYEASTGKTVAGPLAKDVKASLTSDELQLIENAFLSWDYTRENPATIYHLPYIFSLSEIVELSLGIQDCGWKITWLSYLF